VRHEGILDAGVVAITATENVIRAIASVRWNRPSPSRKRLKQFDGIAGRIFYQDLLAAIPDNNLVSEAIPRFIQSFYGSGYVVDLYLNAIPTTRHRLLPARHGLPRATGSRPVQQQM